MMLTYVLPCPSQRQGPDRRIHRIHRQIRRFYRLQADNAWQKRCRPVCKPVRSSSHELQLPTCDRDVCLKCSTFSHYHAQVAALLAEAPSEGLPPEEAPQTSRGARDGPPALAFSRNPKLYICSCGASVTNQPPTHPSSSRPRPRNALQ